MNWFLGKLVFRIICGEGNHTPQFEEQLRLVAAGDKQEAFLKARQIGQDSEEVLVNVKEQLVQWKFINVSELYKLNGWIDGAELYSWTGESDDAENYIAFTNRKAEDIESGCTHEILKLL